MFPRLIEIGPITVYSFGLMVIVGFGAGLVLATRLARERGLPDAPLQDAALLILLAGIIGARLLYVLLDWKRFAGQPFGIAEIWRGGMSFHGGAAAGIVAGVLYMRRRRLPVLAMADAAAPGLALGYAIGRIGCLLNGCCYGTPTTLPWGIHFPAAGGDPGQLYHPTQLYAAILNLALCAGLVWAYRRPHRVGQVLALYVAAYSAYRFAIEALRKGVTAEVLAFGLTQAQVFSMLAFVAGAAWWVWLNRNARPAPEPAAEGPAPSPAGTTG